MLHVGVIQRLFFPHIQEKTPSFGSKIEVVHFSETVVQAIPKRWYIQPKYAYGAVLQWIPPCG